jgi:hypothetical protein
MLGTVIAAFAGAWLIVASCVGGSRGPLRELTITVRDDGGEPLAEVTVETGGRALGATDAHGSLKLALRAAISVSVRCPEAYRPAPPQRVKADSGPSALSFVCRPRLRTIAIVVSAPEARGLSLRADAQNLGRVDDQGLLHAVLKRAPGSTLSISLSARGGQAFATRTLLVEDRDRIVLFDPRGPEP